MKIDQQAKGVRLLMGEEARIRRRVHQRLR